MIVRLAAPWALLVFVCVTAGLLASRGPVFAMHGNLTASLRPGIEVPLDVTVSNPHPYPIKVNSVWVAVSRVAVTSQDPTAVCGPDDFAVRQTAAAIELTVPAHGHLSLSDLDIPKSSWPRVRLVSSPTRSQDGCKNAKLTLGYSGVGTLWTL